MQADQILYLHPPSAEELAPKVDVDGGDLPDVVLEVDYSTDVRVRKLPFYDGQGLPGGLGRRAGRGFAESSEVAAVRSSALLCGVADEGAC